jgi:maltooligosyltrehalose synthase
VAVPRLTTRLDIADRFPLGPATWQDTELELAGLADGGKLRNVFTGASVAASADNEATIIKASDLFADFPVALLLGE